MGPICDPFIPNIGLSGLPLTAPRKTRLRSHPGSQMARPDRPHLGAHIVLTWVPPGMLLGTPREILRCAQPDWSPLRVGREFP